MKFFLDTADIESIKRFSEWGIVDGITTNPSIIAKAGANLEERVKEIASIVDGPVSSEVLSTDYEGMMKEAREYSKWADNIYVKLPMTEEGMRALHTCSQEGIKTNVTLIFSAAQALIAMKAGATVISPFVGRLDDIAEDGMELVAEIMAMHHNYCFDTEVLVASVRHPQHIIDSAIMGAHICTIPPAVAEKLVHHPLTDKGLAKFLADWEAVKDKQ